MGMIIPLISTFYSKQHNQPAWSWRAAGWLMAEWRLMSPSFQDKICGCCLTRKRDTLHHIDYKMLWVILVLVFLSSLLWHDRTAIDVHLWKLRSLKAECYRNFSRDGWDVRTNLTRFFESTFDISHTCTSSCSGWWKPGVSSSYFCLSWTPSPRNGRPPETAKLCQRKRLAQSSRRNTTLTSQRNHGHLLDVYIYLRLTVDRQISAPEKIYENSQLFNPTNWPKPIHRILYVCRVVAPPLGIGLLGSNRILQNKTPHGSARWCYGWWFRNPVNQLRLVVYAIIYRVL